MKYVMISNYMNHHQISFCDHMHLITNGCFWFVATKPAADFRIKLGYTNMDQSREYIVASYCGIKEAKLAKELCENADVLILGNVDSSFKARKKPEQLVFYYSERIFKNKKDFGKNAGRFMKYALKHFEYKNCYLLCASAYAAKDYRLTCNFSEKALKWGYFPETKYYNESELKKSKTNAIPKILWVGRLISWKHPELAVETADYLHQRGMDFQMEIIGLGEMEATIKSLIEEKQLSNFVSVSGSLPSNEVRKRMEQANIFLFTSDENEGWGAVVNEAMNSACAVIGAEEAGSVPYLIDNQTGRKFHSRNKHELFEATEELVLNRELTLKLGFCGYKRIITKWNGNCAAERLVQFVDSVFAKKIISFEDGPCSPS